MAKNMKKNVYYIYIDRYNWIALLYSRNINTTLSINYISITFLKINWNKKNDHRLSHTFHSSPVLDVETPVILVSVETRLLRSVCHPWRNSSRRCDFTLQLHSLCKKSRVSVGLVPFCGEVSFPGGKAWQACELGGEPGAGSWGRAVWRIKQRSGRDLSRGSLILHLAPYLVCFLSPLSLH